MAIFTSEKYPLLVLTNNNFNVLDTYSAYSESRMLCKNRIVDVDLYNQMYEMVYPCEFTDSLFRTRMIQKDGWIINTRNIINDTYLINTYSKTLSDTEKLVITTMCEYGDIYVSIDENETNLAKLHINLAGDNRNEKKTFTLEKNGSEFYGYKLYLNKDSVNTTLEKYCTDLTSVKIFSRVDD